MTSSSFEDWFYRDIEMNGDTRSERFDRLLVLLHAQHSMSETTKKCIIDWMATAYHVGRMHALEERINKLEK